MAYAERRGKFWRVRYKRPDGDWDGESGFETKEEALNWGRDQETDMRRNDWHDPHAGDITLDEWINEWWPAQDLGPRTENRNDYLIRTHIRPAFGKRCLNTLTSRQEIEAWEKRITSTEKKATRGRYARSTAHAARSLLGTILGDAAERKLIPVNAGARRRGRGRKSRGRSKRRASREKEWSTPLDVLLIAERVAVLSGRDDDFVMVITKGWTGFRWGEVIGLEETDVHESHVNLDWQLSELKSQFTKVPPKDESYRQVDLPPFLSDLLIRHLRSRKTGRCRCPGARCGGQGRYLFLGPGRAHYQRSAYSRRFWHPAVDGTYPEENGKTRRPVLVDCSGIWPGRPVRPWPRATPGEPFKSPEGRGIPRLISGDGRGRCAHCHRTIPLRRDGTLINHGTEEHPCPGSRKPAASDPVLGSWLPIRAGLTPHGLRHGHETWMIEDGIPEVLRCDRLGHEMQGIQATYSHVSSPMRDQVKRALQQRWESALDERIKLCPRSPVEILDTLMAERREQQQKMISQKSPRTG